LFIARVHLHDDLIRDRALNGGDLGADTLERCVVAHRSGIEIDTVDVEVLVAVVVLLIEDRLVVRRPRVIADAALLVGGHDLVIVLANRFDPDLQDVFLVRREPRQSFAIRRELRIRPLRISEEHLAWNQRRQIGKQWSDAEQSNGERQEPDDRFHSAHSIRRSSGKIALQPKTGGPMKGVKALALLVLVLYALPSFGAHVAGYLKIDGVPGSS